MLEIVVLCMLDGNNLVKAHDCYMQLDLGIKYDCCFHVCICRIILELNGIVTRGMCKLSSWLV